jgi:hypothetical protein
MTNCKTYLLRPEARQVTASIKRWPERIKDTLCGLTIASTLLACGGTTQMAHWASQETGCIEEQITISSVRRTDETASYYATCNNGSVYECESSGGYVNGVSTSCEALEGANGSDSSPSGEGSSAKAIAIATWTPIQFETCPVTALMPLVPRETPTQPSPGVLSKEYAESGSNEWTANVGCAVAELSEGTSLLDNPEGNPRAIARRNAQNVGGELTSFRLAENGRMAHVVIELSGLGTMLQRLWLTHDTVVVALVAPRERFGNEQLVTFFGGVKVGQ